MFFRLFVSLVFLCSSASQGQEPPGEKEVKGDSALKVATVDIQKLFQGYRKTLIAEREIDFARAEIQKMSQEATNEIQMLRRQAEERIINVRTGNASQEEIAELQRELPIIQRELNQAEQEKRQERDAANQELNHQMVRRMEGILEEIVELTAKKGESDGFDIVIDISGANSNQVSPVLFAKNATDITSRMEKELSKSGGGKR